MNRYRKKRHSVAHDNVHRWLVSYADYMTLLFALFVVLYAMAMVNEEPFESITQSVGRVFQANEEKPKNKGQGEDILNVNTSQNNKRLFGNGILEEAGPELLEAEQTLSNISDTQVGSNLTSLETELNTALYDLVESGFAQLQIDGDWLEIELNSALLFPSGSSSVTNSATKVLAVIFDVVGDVNNYIRIRGYTDNQVINTEIFASNWELSVFRASAILRALEKQGIDPARMAIEGYGQYYPTGDNNTAQGRKKNRRVVVAISKYGLKKPDIIKAASVETKKAETTLNVAEPKQKEDEIQLIRLPNGGIRISTRKKNDTNSNNDN